MVMCYVKLKCRLCIPLNKNLTNSLPNYHKLSQIIITSKKEEKKKKKDVTTKTKANQGTNKTNLMRIPCRHLLVKLNNGSTRTLCETCSKLTIKTPERRQ